MALFLGCPSSMFVPWWPEEASENMNVAFSSCNKQHNDFSTANKKDEWRDKWERQRPATTTCFRCLCRGCRCRFGLTRSLVRVKNCCKWWNMQIFSRWLWICSTVLVVVVDLFGGTHYGRESVRRCLQWMLICSRQRRVKDIMYHKSNTQMKRKSFIFLNSDNPYPTENIRTRYFPNPTNPNYKMVGFNFLWNKFWLGWIDFLDPNPAQPDLCSPLVTVMA